MRILTNHPGQKESPTWDAVSTYIPPEGRGRLASFLNAIQLYMEAVRKEYDCVILGAGASDGIFALIKTCLPFNVPPLILIDCLWYSPKRNARGILKRAIVKLQDRGVDTYIVWARREIGAYSREFGLPGEKFHFIHYHNTMHGFDCAPRDCGYIFSGGNFARDYATLMAAVDGLDIPVKIASTRPENFAGIRIPANVEIRGYDGKGYLESMAGCRINVVALSGGLLHSGGQQTIINSMTMGKPTIVTDPEGGRDYIDDGVDGFLIPPANPHAMREKIQYLLGCPEAAREMGERARARAISLTTDNHFRAIACFAEERIKSRIPLNE